MQDHSISALQQAWACDRTALVDIRVEWNRGTSALEIWGIYPFQKEYYFTEVPVQFFVHLNVSHQRNRCVLIEFFKSLY